MKKLFARLMMTAVMLFTASMVEAQRMGDDTYVVIGSWLCQRQRECIS